MLSAFLATDAISLRNDDEQITNEFLQYLTSYQSDTELIDTFLSGDDEIANTLKKLLPKNIIAGNKERSRGLSHLEELPSETLSVEIGRHLSVRDYLNLSQASSDLYKKSKEPEFWITKLLEAGCNPSALKKVIKLNLLKRTEYKNLYINFSKLDDPHQIREAWQLCCLSGNPSTLQAAPKPDDSSIIMSDEDIYEALRLSMIAGNMDSIKYLLNTLNLPQRSNNKQMKEAFGLILKTIVVTGNIRSLEFILHALENSSLDVRALIRKHDFIHDAIRAKNIPMIDYMVSIYRAYENISLKHTGISTPRSYSASTSWAINDATLDRAHILHTAVSTGNVDVINHVWNICEQHHINIAALDLKHRNILHIAVSSGSTPAILLVRKKLLDKTEGDLYQMSSCMDKQGRTPIDYAQGNTKMIDVLTKPLNSLLIKNYHGTKKTL